MGKVTPYERLFGDDVSPRGRAVVNAFRDARKSSTQAILACGLLPEVSESCTESLHRTVHTLSERHLERERAVGEVRDALQRHGLSGAALETAEQAIASLVHADTTAAYLVGLAVGLGVSSLEQRLKEGLDV